MDVHAAEHLSGGGRAEVALVERLEVGHRERLQLEDRDVLAGAGVAGAVEAEGAVRVRDLVVGQAAELLGRVRRGGARRRRAGRVGEALRGLGGRIRPDLRRQNMEDAYGGAYKQIETLLEKLAASSRLQPIVAPAAGDHPPAEFKSNTIDFEKMVLRAKEYISEGDIFQVVLSQRFESEFSADPLDLYRCLRFGNPSPYMFLLNFGDEFCALGSSPELHVRVRGRTAELRPIAGTRPRGTDPRSDEANARELLADPKERAEHVMLIDLARNDLGRIAQIGSVRVTEQMTIERYSHVMHIVSHVEARLRDGLTAFDAFRATFPAGTVSGTPKIRAMQIIAELEKARRGFYAGAVGWFGFDGNCDSCIALRSVVLKNGRAFVQAGAGIVADSDPAREREETERKAMAVLAAIARAKNL